MKNLILIGVLLFCSGCRYVYIHDRYPEYELPGKAKIAKISEEQLSPLNQETKNDIVNSVKNLKTEALKLRAILESHNKYAKNKNEKYDKIFRKDRVTTP
jgi:hypothetical protein